MRRFVTSALEAAGMIVISVGVALFSVPAGVIVAGVGLIVVGYRQAP